MGRVIHLPTKTIPTVDWDARLRGLLDMYPAGDVPKTSITAPNLTVESAASIAQSIMVDQETKLLPLAAKQARLLQILRAKTET